MDARRLCVLDTSLISVWIYPARRMISKQYVNAGVNMQMFGDPAEAMRWLEAQ